MHLNFALRKLFPLLSISLTDTDVDTTSSGGDGGTADTGTEADTGAQADGKAAADATDADAKAETKTDTKAPDTKAKPDPKVEAAAALSKSYEGWKPKLPEGLPFNEKEFGDFSKTFIEQGIKPEQAQVLVDTFAKAELARLHSVAESIKAEQKAWDLKVRNDKELAGEDGKGLDVTARAGRAAMQKFATPELRSLLDSSGLSGHPEMLRLMSRVGKTLKEDSTATSTTAGSGKQLTERQKLAARYNHPSSKSLFDDASH